MRGDEALSCSVDILARDREHIAAASRARYTVTRNLDAGLDASRCEMFRGLADDVHSTFEEGCSM